MRLTALNLIVILPERKRRTEGAALRFAHFIIKSSCNYVQNAVKNLFYYSGAKACRRISIISSFLHTLLTYGVYYNSNKRQPRFKGAVDEFAENMAAEQFCSAANKCTVHKCFALFCAQNIS